MSRWFRHYAGMMRDDKLVRVAIRSGQTIERVVWIWGAILESAAEIDDHGRYDFDASEAAYFLRADQADIHAIEAGLADTGRIASGAVVKWGDRQFKSDRSAPRQADYRERKRAALRESDAEQTSCNDGVTSLSRHGDAPEAETELETETEESEAIASVSPRQPISEAVSFYNVNAAGAGWPLVAKLSDKRGRSLRSRLREHGIDGWRAGIVRARSSPYLGHDPPVWFTFNWLIMPDNFLKLIEGNYDRRNSGGPDPTLVALSSFGGSSGCR